MKQCICKSFIYDGEIGIFRCRKCKKIFKPESLFQQEKEFETAITYHPNLKEEIQKYLMKNLYYKDEVKVKIKCKDGCIQIERLRE